MNKSDMSNAGRIGFLIKGEYSNTATYEFLDIVYYNGASYVAKKTSAGNIPERSNEYWQIFAEGGDPGAQNVSVMVGATEESDGAEGLVPAPTVADINKFLKADGTWGEPLKKTYTCQIAVPGDYIQEMLDSGSSNIIFSHSNNRIGYRILDSDTKQEISPSSLAGKYVYFKDIIRIHDFSVTPYEVGNKAWWMVKTIGDAYSAFPNTGISFWVDQLTFSNEKVPNTDWTDFLERYGISNELSKYGGFFFQIVFEIEKNISEWIMECIPYPS